MDARPGHERLRNFAAVCRVPRRPGPFRRPAGKRLFFAALLLVFSFAPLTASALPQKKSLTGPNPSVSAEAGDKPTAETSRVQGTLTDPVIPDDASPARPQKEKEGSSSEVAAQDEEAPGDRAAETGQEKKPVASSGRQKDSSGATQRPVAKHYASRKVESGKGYHKIEKEYKGNQVKSGYKSSKVKKSYGAGWSYSIPSLPVDEKGKPLPAGGNSHSSPQ